MFETDPLLYTKTINGHQISFADYGYPNDGPPIVTFSGWAQDHRGWADITPYLMEEFRVISVCFRGHGPNRDPVGDFGFEECARDVIALMDDLQVDRFFCLSASMGGWSAMRTAEIAGDRVLAVLISDLLMTEASPQFLEGIKLLQGRDTWRPQVVKFFKAWCGGTTNPGIRRQAANNVGGFNFEAWARSGRTITQEYAKFGSPMKRMETLLPNPPLIHHIYSQPDDEGYENLHKEFQKKYPDWFSYTHIEGETHFPHIENAEQAANALKVLIAKALARPAPAKTNGASQ